jgi:protein-L-isoaspartate(D-aspartate) O-methyltransferase
MSNLLAIRQKKLLDELLKHEKLDDYILRAFFDIDRTHFVPKGFGVAANKLNALPLKSEQWISSPLTVAKMTKALEPKGADSVLEIGCGSGYQAAILSRLFRRVFSIERIEVLLFEARAAFRELGILNVNIKLDDGLNGWPEFAKFDRILFSASIDEIPQNIFDQLSDDDGILVSPITKGNKQIITKFRKNKYMIVQEEIEECLFVPVLRGVSKAN